MAHTSGRPFLAPLLATTPGAAGGGQAWNTERVSIRSAEPWAEGPYLRLDRVGWRRLAANTPLPLTGDDIVALRGRGDPIDLAEADVVYRPLSRLLALHVAAATRLHRVVTTFVGEGGARTPYVIGLAGSVASGKSTTARLLRTLLRRWPETPRVDLVTTDGFLHPNAVLERRGLMKRKGFPESYDAKALLRFLQAVKSGAPEVIAPVYSHRTYDIVPGRHVVVHSPDVLIVEGLNVLQPPRTRAGRTALAVADFFDFTIYVDAAPEDLRRWYIERFMQLRATAYQQPDDYFHQYAALSEDEAVTTADSIWGTINQPNLISNIAPTRDRATLVLRKGADHRMEEVLLRRI